MSPFHYRRLPIRGVRCHGKAMEMMKRKEPLPGRLTRTDCTFIYTFISALFGAYADTFSVAIGSTYGVTNNVMFQSNTELSDSVGDWFATPARKASVKAQYGLIGDWCFGTSVTGMIDLFRDKGTFNEDISNWDVSSVRTLDSTFRGASTFNQDLSSWDVTPANNMRFVSSNAVSFNQDISSWNVSSVAVTKGMFDGASSFNQYLCAWGSRIPTSAGKANMLKSTNCPSKFAPNLSSNPPGPFCHVCRN